MQSSSQPRHTIPLENILSGEEYRRIDRYCENNPSCTMAELADFLDRAFKLELTLDPDIIVGFTRDSTNMPGNASALCRPKNERECAVILRACFASKTLCTISAGRSNLTGSATPQGGIVISICNMLTPAVSADQDKKTVVCPMGIILEDMRNAVLEQTHEKLVFPVNPTSRSDAAIGGVLACNASGFSPGPRGSVRQWVERIDFLLPDGLAVRAARGEYVSKNGKFILEHNGRQRELPVPCYPRPAIKNASGPFSTENGAMDFVDFVVGSEGIYGLITGCVLKLAEKPPGSLDLFFSLPDEPSALKVHQYLLNTLGSFQGMDAFEYFGVNSRKYMDNDTLLFSPKNQVGIYVRIPLTDTTFEDAAEKWWEMLTAPGCGVDEDSILVLDNPRQLKMFLEARHSIPANTLEAVRQRGTVNISTDAIVPVDTFPEFLQYTHALLRLRDLEYLCIGHFGDCQLHFVILPEKEQMHEGQQAYDLIIEKSAELGGVYSGEHGTGKRKHRDFIKCYGRSAVEELKAVKKALDPDFILNRGNVFSME